MVRIHLNETEFFLKENHDFSWLTTLGRVFRVFAQNDSGNISFGVDCCGTKYFIKAAGLKTADSVCTPEEAVCFLKKAMTAYEEIGHPSLIKLVKHYAVGDLYAAIFRWAEGDCLFDHWNFETYRNNPQIIPPAQRFKALPVSERISSAEVLFSFLQKVAESKYVAVDFYDGSIMYDFYARRTTICDIDLFRKKPAFNDIGENYWGTKRLKAPEEYIYNAVIDEVTNVFTLGALLFNNYFGHFTDDEIKYRYQNHVFLPCSLEKWELNKACYNVACKAVALDRSKRYPSISEFHSAWNAALQNNGK